MMERVSCTLCGRPLTPGRWGRFVRRHTENGYETVIACNLHDVSELENKVINDPPDVNEQPPVLPQSEDGDQQMLDEVDSQES